jgi:hypothetical protein
MIGVGIGVSNSLIKTKNLVPPFTQWTKHANATIKSAYELELIATAQYQVSNVLIPVISLQNYVFSRGNTNGRFWGWWKDVNKNVIGGSFGILEIGEIGSKIITPVTNAVYLELDADNKAITSGTFTFVNPQLELGTIATPFEPKR